MPKIIFQPLMIANPQSIKRLGHFLTADCKSAGTPNGGWAYPAQRNRHIRRYGRHIRRSGIGISGATEFLPILSRGRILCPRDMHLLRAKLYFVFGGWCIGLPSTRRSTPLGVPTEDGHIRRYGSHVIRAAPLPACPVSDTPEGDRKD